MSFRICTCISVLTEFVSVSCNNISVHLNPRFMPRFRNCMQTGGGVYRPAATWTCGIGVECGLVVVVGLGERRAQTEFRMCVCEESKWRRSESMTVS